MSTATSVRLTRWAVILIAFVALELIPRSGFGNYP